jgi:hypothetical protein
MYAMEASLRGAFAHRGATEPEIAELSEGERAVLLGCKHRNRHVERGLAEKRNVWLRFTATLGHKAIVALKASRMGDAVRKLGNDRSVALRM